MKERLMKRIGMARMSPAMAVALIALVCALGGTSIAAGGLLAPRNSVNSAAIIDHTLLAKDFKAGQLPSAVAGARGAAGVAGPAGAPGPAGPAGARGQDGTAKAYAYVNADGTLDPARSLNITSAHVAGVGECFSLPFTPKNVVASIQGYEGPPFVPQAGFILTGLGSFGGCDPQDNAWISIKNASNPLLRANLPFYIMFN